MTNILTWRFPIWILLIFYLMGSHLLSSSEKVQCDGKLTVEPAGIFQLGSDLTLYCHLREDKSMCPMRPPMLLVDGAVERPETQINCTASRFRLAGFRRPKALVICVMDKGGRTHTVCGTVLRGGLPPNRPTDVDCETSQTSGRLDCWWDKGQETFLTTTYNVSLTSSNGTQVLYVGVQTENVTVARTLLDENESYRLTVTAHNALGASMSEPHSVCVKDVVVPETPLHVTVEFGNDSSAAVRCHSPESSRRLGYTARLRPSNSIASWLLVEGSHNASGLVKVERLKALTEYEFQARACYSGPAGGLGTSRSGSRTAPGLIPSGRPRCSDWSPPVRSLSPGKGPSLELQVWRTLGRRDDRGRRDVTVLWKPPNPEDYSGDLQHYEVLLGPGGPRAATCPPSGRPCVVQVSPDVRTLHVSAVCSYGRSPPAVVHLGPSGSPGPVLERAGSEHGGVVLSWAAPHSGPGGDLLGYVTEWTGGPAELGWSREPRDHNTTFIRGLTPGVRYNFSVYAETTLGLSSPSSVLLYSQEQIPLSGLKVSVVDRKAGRVLIQWEEMPVARRKGFIRSYTVHVKTSGPTEHRISQPGSDPRRLWVACPDGALVGLSASTTAGEGPKGQMVPCKNPDTQPSAGLVVALVLTMTILSVSAIIFICWSSVRERIKSWAPSWLDVPKPEDSRANTLLKGQDVQPHPRPPSPTSHSDPPLSPIEEVPRRDPETAHLLPTPPGPLQVPRAWPRLTPETEWTPLPAEGPPEPVGYKPHAPPTGEDMGETVGGGGGGGGEQKDVPDSPGQEQEQGGGFSMAEAEFPRLRSLCCEGDGDLPRTGPPGSDPGSWGHLSGVVFGGLDAGDQGPWCAGYTAGGWGHLWRTEGPGTWGPGGSTGEEGGP